MPDLKFAPNIYIYEFVCMQYEYRTPRRPRRGEQVVCPTVYVQRLKKSSRCFISSLLFAAVIIRAVLRHSSLSALRLCLLYDTCLFVVSHTRYLVYLRSTRTD